MTDYYKRLGVAHNATQQEIKTAYRELALIYHPDKPEGDEEEFKRIQEAYDTLSDHDKRQAYDHRNNALNGDCLGHLERLEREGLKFFPLQSPDSYDHYAFINRLFDLRDSETLVSGQALSREQCNRFWEMTNFVDYNLFRRKNYLIRAFKIPDEKIKQELYFIQVNINKLIAVSQVLLGCEQRKSLYDLAMGFTQDQEMLAIGRLIGGRKVLLSHIKKQVLINSAEAIFNLRDAGLLNAKNFRQLSLIKAHDELLGISSTTKDLLENHLLKQTNFDRIIKLHQYDAPICIGISRLRSAGILTQKCFDVVVNAKQRAEHLGCELSTLQEVGLLNDEAFKLLTQNKLVSDIYSHLYEMQKNGQLQGKEETSGILSWNGPRELNQLNQHLDQMIAYGVYLISRDVEKGKTALLLGLDLKKDLKTFFEEGGVGDQENVTRFKESFVRKLHSKDKEMSAHREQWKVILANIAIAFTGVGLFALGINYALTGQCFFATTKREQLVENIEETNWLAPTA